MPTSLERKIVINRPNEQQNRYNGESVEKAYWIPGDYYKILEGVISRDECIYVGLTEGVIFVDSTNKVITPISVETSTRETTLETVCILLLQTIALADYFGFRTGNNPELNRVRYSEERLTQ